MEILEAAERGDLQVLEKLGNSTVTEAISDEFGRNCLHYAARHGGIETLHFLVQNRHFSGSSRSNIGATPALEAAAAGNLEALQWLLQNTQCNVDDQDGNGTTALHLSARFGHMHVIEWLLEEARADPSKRTSLGGLALHFAVVGGVYDVIKMLLDDDHGSVNMQMKNGVTASYLASQEGHIEILRLLILEYRGNVKIAAFDGMTCVHAAAQSGHLDCVRFLIQEEKCNPNDRDFDGATPLHYAASQGHADLIHWMMTVGGAKIMLDNLGGSPLHNAAETNQMECVKVLISNGCSIDITDNNGLTAAELARKCLNEQCAELIETYKPQSQKVVDEDILYLQSVQSPRPVVIQPTQLVEGFNKDSTQQGHLTAPNFQGNGSHDQPTYQSNNNTQIPFNTESGKKHTGVVIGFQERSKPPVGSRKRSRSPVVSPKRSKSPVESTEKAISHVGRAVKHFEEGNSGTDIGDNSSIVDPATFPVETQRQFSKDFTTDNKFSADYTSQSNSSLSSLSVLDEVIENASRNMENQQKISQNAPVLQKIKQQQLLSSVQETSSLIKQPTSTQHGVFISQPISVNKAGGYSHLSQTELKPVNIKSGHDFGEKLVKFATKMEVHDSDSVNNPGSINIALDYDRNSRESIVSNGHMPVVNASGGGVKTNGSVNLTRSGYKSANNVLVISINTQVENGAHRNASEHKQPAHVHELHNHIHTSNGIKTNEFAPVSNVSPPCFVDLISGYGKTSPAFPSTFTVAPPTASVIAPPTASVIAPPTVSVIAPSTSSVIALPTASIVTPPNALVQTSNTNTSPPPPPLSTIPKSKPRNDKLHANSHTSCQIPATQCLPTAVSQLIGEGNQPIHFSAAFVPIPPPAPPLLAAPKPQLMGNGNQIQASKIPSGQARPAALLTSDMMVAQRNKLVPAQAWENTATSIVNDFITELKMATRGPLLKKMSKFGDPSSRNNVTPAISFSGGQKLTVEKEVPTDDKDSKTELTGEWDPKNFVDRIPNKDELPAWKIQLQAKHIAEKTMKEELERRKIADNEARFKNMPAWKRAMIEKKEAEAKAASGEKQLEPQKMPHKHAININVQPKSGNPTDLAPWQLELKGN